MENKLMKISLLLLPFVLAIASLGVGKLQVDFIVQMKILLSNFFPIKQTWSSVQESLILNVRLPRILLALLIGAGLSIAGAAFQAMFSNPLVSSDILGVSAGAGFGAIIGMLLFNQSGASQILALLMGIAAMGLTFFVSGGRKNLSILILIIAGTIVNGVFQALISFIKFVVDSGQELPVITYWLMGSLSTASYKHLIIVGPIILIGIVMLWSVRWRINILSFSDEEARAMGISVQKLRLYVITGTTLITAASVSVSGIVGWVGLVIPHVARKLVGNNHQYVLPVSVSLGASYLLLIDNLARSLTTAEIPLSILTAVIGAPFFAYLLYKSGGSWG